MALTSGTYAGLHTFSRSTVGYKLNGSGLYESTAIDAVRIESGGMLIEPAQSSFNADHFNASFAKLNNAVVSTASASTDLFTTSQKYLNITDDSSGGTGIVNVRSADVACAAGDLWIEGRVKISTLGTSKWLAVSIASFTGSGGGEQYFDIENSAAGTLNAVDAYCRAENGFTIFGAKFTIGAGDVTGKVILSFGTDDGAKGANLRDGSQNMDIKYFIMSATTGSPFVFTGGAGARSKDICELTDEAPWFDAVDGTFFCRFESTRGADSRRVFEFSDGTTSERIYVEKSSANNKVRVAAVYAGTTTTADSTIDFDASTDIALAFTTSGIEFSVNGETPVTVTSSIDTANLTEVHLGQDTADYHQLSGTISKFKYRPDVLSGTGLSTLRDDADNA